MDFSNDDIQLLSKKLDAGDLVVFVGSGLSRNAPASSGRIGCPSWADLTLQIAQLASRETGGLAQPTPLAVRQAIKKSRPDLPAIAEQLALASPGVHERAISKAFSGLSLRPYSVMASLIHNLLIRLPWQWVITTNFDLLLEEAARVIFPHSKKVEVIAGFPGQLPSPSGRICIWKLHGCATRGSIVFTDSEFAQAYMSGKLGPLLKSLLLTKNLLFLGVGFSDPGVSNIFREIRQAISPPWPTQIWAYVPEVEKGKIRNALGPIVELRTYSGSPRKAILLLLRQLIERSVGMLPEVREERLFNRLEQRASLSRYVDSVVAGCVEGPMAAVGDDRTDRRQFTEEWTAFECQLRRVKHRYLDAVAYCTPNSLAERMSVLYPLGVSSRSSAERVIRSFSQNYAPKIDQPEVLHVRARGGMVQFLASELLIPVFAAGASMLGIIFEIESEEDLRCLAGNIQHVNILRFPSFRTQDVDQFLQFGALLPDDVRGHLQQIFYRSVESSAPRRFLDMLSLVYESLSDGHV